MSRLSHRGDNLARKETFSEEVESLPVQKTGKENLPDGKKFLPLADPIQLAHECLLSPLARQKEMANTLNVSEGQLSRWASGDQIPLGRAFQIIRVWMDFRRERIKTLQEKIETYCENFLFASVGANRDKGVF